MSVKSIGGGLVVVGLVGGAGKGAVAGGEGGEVGVLVELEIHTYYEEPGMGGQIRVT